MTNKVSKPKVLWKPLFSSATAIVAVVLFSCLLFNQANAQAITPISWHLTGLNTQAAQQKTINIKQQATMWGLSTQAYQHYLWLMQNTPSGHWYKQLDPAEVLGLNAKTKMQMMTYAKVQAKNMHQRVGREIAFDLAYAKAYRELYPHEKPVMNPKKQQRTAVLHSGDKLWLFIGINTPLGKYVYQHLMKAVQKVSGTQLDIYFVGKHVTVKSIQNWAATTGISPKLVNQVVTLNYGNTRFRALTKGKSATLPFVGIVHDNHFQPVSLSSVL